MAGNSDEGDGGRLRESPRILASQISLYDPSDPISANTHSQTARAVLWYNGANRRIETGVASIEVPIEPRVSLSK